MTRHDPILRAGTEAHYEDARHYDHFYRRRKHDVRYYVEEAERWGGPVLELGVGTGRVAIALARAGVQVVGIDRMPPMLERAAERLAREPRAVRERVTLRRADLTGLRLGQRFPLVISPFNVFMHLYDRTQVERALASVRRHLRPRGRFVFDVLMPQALDLGRNPERTYRGGTATHPVSRRRFRYGESFDYDPVRQVQLITMSFEPEDDPEDLSVTPLAHRQFFPAELEALLHYNGFAIEERHGDFDRSALTGDSESQVVVARLSGRARPARP
jgi:SAM-dependent methyltransferase